MPFYSFNFAAFQIRVFTSVDKRLHHHSAVSVKSDHRVRVLQQGASVARALILLHRCCILLRSEADDLSALGDEIRSVRFHSITACLMIYCRMHLVCLSNFREQFGAGNLFRQVRRLQRVLLQRAGHRRC